MRIEGHLQVLPNMDCHTQNVKDGSQIQVNTINKESATHFSQFLSVKDKKIVRISNDGSITIENDGFLIKKTCISIHC